MVDPGAPPFVRRAARFRLTLPLRYRRAGTSKWDVSTTINISHSGVLFAVTEALDTDERLDIVLTLFQQQDSLGLTQVEIAGRVARSAAPGSESTEAIAAAFFSYEFVHSPG